MTRTDPAIPPVRRAVSVSWDPATAYHRFTAQFATWWPRATHSIGGKKVKQIIFETKVGGRIIEELVDGRRYQWGTVTKVEPPHRVGFTWHPSREKEVAQDVEVSFHPEGSGTRVELVSTGWERLGARGERERKGYSIGWGSVLDVFAGKTSAVILLFGVISRVLTFFLRMTGKLEKSIDEAGGRLPADVKPQIPQSTQTG
jgi:uncharacterized protein YndB with AHSA1/START domain